MALSVYFWLMSLNFPLVSLSLYQVRNMTVVVYRCLFVWCVLSFDSAMWLGTFRLNFPRSSVFLWFYSPPPFYNMLHMSRSFINLIHVCRAFVSDVFFFHCNDQSICAAICSANLSHSFFIFSIKIHLGIPNFMLSISSMLYCLFVESVYLDME